MKKLSSALALGVFGSTCLLGWAMLTLMSEVRNAGRASGFYESLHRSSTRPFDFAIGGRSRIPRFVVS